MLDTPIQETPAQLNKEDSSNYPSKADLSSTENIQFPSPQWADSTERDAKSGKLPDIDLGEHEYVLDRMQANIDYVRNIKKYLLAALYNIPITMGSYYTSLISHDLYGSEYQRWTPCRKESRRSPFRSV